MTIKQTAQAKISGFLNINKPEGFTSHDVVAKLRKILKMKKIGHSGTLDPFATGVLPIAVGPSTRLIQFLQKSKKYLAEIDFSFQTDTDDSTGEKLENKMSTTMPELINNKFLWSKEALIEALKTFEGEIEQIPPIYSAVHHNGKRLYELSREGTTVDFSEIKKRIVKIAKLELKEFNYPKALVELTCSEGTYVRSIARDLGGHLSLLTRLESNGLVLEDAVTLEELRENDPHEFLMHGSDMIDLPCMIFNTDEVKDLRLGRKIHLDKAELEDSEALKSSDIQCLDESGELIGIGVVVKVPNYIYIQPKVIL